MFVREASNREWFVCRRVGKRIGRVGKIRSMFNWHYVKGKNTRGSIAMHEIIFPKTWIGKRIRIKIEEVEE